MLKNINDFQFDEYFKAEATNHGLWHDGTLNIKCFTLLFGIMFTLVLHVIWGCLPNAQEARLQAQAIQGTVTIKGVACSMAGRVVLYTDKGEIEMPTAHPLGSYFYSIYWLGSDGQQCLPLTVNLKYTIVPQQAWVPEYPQTGVTGYYLEIAGLPVGEMAYCSVHAH